MVAAMKARDEARLSTLRMMKSALKKHEVDAMKSLVREHMEQAHSLAVPLLVEIGTGENWRDAK